MREPIRHEIADSLSSPVPVSTWRDILVSPEPVAVSDLPPRIVTHAAATRILDESTAEGIDIVSLLENVDPAAVELRVPALARMQAAREGDCLLQRGGSLGEGGRDYR